MHSERQGGSSNCWGNELHRQMRIQIPGRPCHDWNGAEFYHATASQSMNSFSRPIAEYVGRSCLFAIISFLMRPLLCFSFGFLACMSNSVCTDEDHLLWKGSHDFARAYHEIAKKSFGVRALTERWFRHDIPGLSTACVECFVDQLDCGRVNCTAKCAISQVALDCRQCINRFCMKSFRECVGYERDEDLPIPPWKL